MKNLNSEETLWMILPIVIVVGLLVASILLLPQTQTNIGSKAAAPTVTPTPVTVSPIPKATHPEIVCTSLYQPVCSQNGITYPNACEANLAGVTAFSQGACSQIQTKPHLLPASN